MVDLEDEVVRHIDQWTPEQRELHTLAQKFDAFPIYLDAGIDTTELLAMIRAGIAQHGGSLEAIKQLYATVGIDFNPDEEIWKILEENL